MSSSRVRRPPAAAVLLVLLLLLFGAMILGAAQGQERIPPGSIVALLLYKLGLGALPADWNPVHEPILLTLRLPQVVGAALVGAALATAGTLYQGLLRNPMADPYVVGTSGGAALGAVLGMLLGGRLTFLGFGVVPLAAFLGALGAITLVMSLGSVGGRLPVVSVLLAGFAVSTLLGYTVSLLLFLQPTLHVQLPQLYSWLLGGISVVGWGQLIVVAPVILAGVVGAVALSRTLNAFTLGEDGAARLGISVERDKRFILLLGSLLTATAVSISGLIGFVGLIVPHVVRLVCGPDHRLLLPAAALGGGLFLVLADLLSRTLLPTLGAAAGAGMVGDIPVGIVTAFLGGPFFLCLLRKSRKEYHW